MDEPMEGRRESIVPNIIDDDSPYSIDSVDRLNEFVRQDPQRVVEMITELKTESRTKTHLLNKVAERFNETLEIARTLRDERDSAQEELDKAKVIIQFLQNTNISSASTVSAENVHTHTTTTASTPAPEGVGKSSKLPDPPILENNKDDNFEDWLSSMRNKLEGNADWYPTEAMKKAYVRTRVGGEAVKHIASRFRKESTKPFTTAEEIFDDLNRVYGDPHKEQTALREFRDLKQVGKYREFHAFWSEFQRLANELEYSEKTLLNELRNKMNFGLQKMLAVEAYKATDLYEFARLCMHTDQTIREVETKTKGYRKNFVGPSVPIASTAGGTTSIVKASTPALTRTPAMPSATSSRSSTPFMARAPHPDPIMEKRIKEGRCFNCDLTGHMAKDCPQPRKGRVSEMSAEAEDSGKDAPPS